MLQQRIIKLRTISQIKHVNNGGSTVRYERLPKTPFLKEALNIFLVIHIIYTDIV
jgi:hypothetical protein